MPPKSSTLCLDIFSKYLSSRKEKHLEVSFPCPQLCQPSQGVWHHIVLMVHTKGLRGRCRATLFLDGKPTATEKLPYIHPLPTAVATQFIPFSDASPFLINAHIGTHVDNRHISSLIYRLGPTYLFDEPLSNLPIQRIFLLGPLYVGSFQNPTDGNMVRVFYIIIIIIIVNIIMLLV